MRVLQVHTQAHEGPTSTHPAHEVLQVHTQAHEGPTIHTQLRVLQYTPRLMRVLQVHTQTHQRLAGTDPGSVDQNACGPVSARAPHTLQTADRRRRALFGWQMQLQDGDCAAFEMNEICSTCRTCAAQVCASASPLQHPQTKLLIASKIFCAQVRPAQAPQIRDQSAPNRKCSVHYVWK
ncbi:hypothetical protein WMY93_026326 [Mugilogobius chulae]|uniref:Uncharacterized protein n=1 Tax=Mugilogobius chulae TaxID=88201 RepID=A0AAW0N2W1_9GOBI